MTSFPLRINQIRTGKLNFPEKGGKFGKTARGTRPHYGWDLVAPEGTPVFAVGPGEITQVLHKVPGYGTLIQLQFRHGSRDYWALYAHLSVVWVKQGDRVHERQMIALTGRTGNAAATPPHLHFEVATDANLGKRRTNQIDPALVLGPFLRDQRAGDAKIIQSGADVGFTEQQMRI